MFYPRIFSLVGCVTLCSAMWSAQAQTLADLKPLMAQPDKIVVQEDFNKEKPFDKKYIKPARGTRWSFVDGCYHGIPSTKEFQDAEPIWYYKGLGAKLTVPATPLQFMASYSIRFNDGVSDKGRPFMEFGHHVARMEILPTGTTLNAYDNNSILVYEVKDFKLENSKWYHLLVELKGQELVVQFANGPVFYGKHPRYALPNTSGSNGIGIDGTNGGSVDIDNMTIWTIKDEAQDSWPASREKIPPFNPATLRKSKE